MSKEQAQVDRVAEIRRLVEKYKDNTMSYATSMEGIVTHHARMANTTELNVAEYLLSELDKAQRELNQSGKRWEKTNNELQRVYQNYSERGVKYRKLQALNDQLLLTNGDIGGQLVRMQGELELAQTRLNELAHLLRKDAVTIDKYQQDNQKLIKHIKSHTHLIEKEEPEAYNTGMLMAYGIVLAELGVNP